MGEFLITKRVGWFDRLGRRFGRMLWDGSLGISRVE
jgi:hypothetical protein